MWNSGFIMFCQTTRTELAISRCQQDRTKVQPLNYWELTCLNLCGGKQSGSNQRCACKLHPKIKACVMQTLRREQRGTGGAAEKAKRKEYVSYLMLFWHLCNSFLSLRSLFQVRFRHHGAIHCRTKIEQRQKQKSLEHISGHGRKPAFRPLSSLIEPTSSVFPTSRPSQWSLFRLQPELSSKGSNSEPMLAWCFNLKRVETYQQKGAGPEWEPMTAF